MPNLSIKNVPEPVVQKLRRRAARNHRSMQGELMALICHAIEESEETSRSNRLPRDVKRSTKTVEQIWAERRARRPVPALEGPRAVDIIRADRDGR